MHEDYNEAAKRLVMMYGEYVHERADEDEAPIDMYYAEAVALACAELINRARGDLSCPICGSYDVELASAEPDKSYAAAERAERYTDYCPHCGVTMDESEEEK